jgi:glycosyltransferase involved in cell wall biosynthesis
VDNKPVFSIVMPTYNQSSYLSEAIESVFNQDFPRWELIVIDNSSDDETTQVLERYKDHRVSVFRIQNNGVIAKSRNLGIEKASAEWVAFLDSDDVWESSKLREVKKVIDNKHPALVYHRMRYLIQNTPGKLMKTRKLKSNAFIDLLVNGNSIANSSVVVKKEVLMNVGLINESKELIGIEDFNTWLKISKTNVPLIYCKQELGRYRIHGKSYSSTAHRALPTPAVAEFLSDIPARLVRKMNCNNSYIRGRQLMNAQNFETATKEFYLTISGATLHLRLKAAILLMQNYARQLKFNSPRSN